MHEINQELKKIFPSFYDNKEYPDLHLWNLEQHIKTVHNNTKQRICNTCECETPGYAHLNLRIQIVH